MNTILAILHTPNEPDQYFRFDVPSPGEQNFYRHVTSYDCFRNRELSRAFPYNEKTNTVKPRNKEIKYCSIYRTDDLRSIQWTLDHNNITLDNIPHTGSVYDFYNTINYDRKKKKYL